MFIVGTIFMIGMMILIYKEKKKMKISNMPPSNDINMQSLPPGGTNDRNHTEKSLPPIAEATEGINLYLRIGAFGKVYPFWLFHFNIFKLHSYKERFRQQPVNILNNE